MTEPNKDTMPAAPSQDATGYIDKIKKVSAKLCGEHDKITDIMEATAGIEYQRIIAEMDDDENS